MAEQVRKAMFEWHRFPVPHAARTASKLAR